jgi:hypothetical protein
MPDADFVPLVNAMAPCAKRLCPKTLLTVIIATWVTLGCSHNHVGTWVVLGFAVICPSIFHVVPITAWILGLGCDAERVAEEKRVQDLNCKTLGPCHMNDLHFSGKEYETQHLARQ